MKFTTLKLALSIMMYGIITGTEDSDFRFPYFEFYEGNDRTEDLLCRVPLAAVQATKDKMTDKDGGIHCKNDEARSMALCRGVAKSRILVYDSDEACCGRPNAEIKVIKTFGGCITIPTFEKTQYVGKNNQVHVQHTVERVNRKVRKWKLDGKVSSFKVELPWKMKRWSEWVMYRFALHAKEKLGEYSGEWIKADELVSSNGVYTLRMQKDGNLVLYKSDLSTSIGGDVKEAIWASDTSGVGKGPYRLVMQEDNHLVVYDGMGNVVWASGVYVKDPNQWQKSGFAFLQDDGNFVVRDGNWDVMWSSGTHGGKQGNYGEGNKHQASCDSKCEKCNNGQGCNDWCSNSDWCGSSADYQWTDCRACN